MYGKFWILLKICGIAAFQTTSKPFKYSCWFLLIGYALLLSNVTILFYGLRTSFLSNSSVYAVNQRRTKTAEIILLLDKSTLMISCAICLFSGTFNTKNLHRIARAIVESKELKEYRNFPVMKICKYGLILGVFMLLLSISELYFSLFPLFSAPILYLRLFIFLNIFIFSSAVLALKMMFQTLNRKLNMNVNFRELAPNNVLPLVDYVKEFPGVTSSKSCQGVDSLRELCAVHWKLCLLGSDLNGAFNGQLIAIFISCLVRIVTRPYFLFLSVEYAIKVEVAKLINHVAWIVIFWLQLCLLVWSSSAATNEAEKTTTLIVHNLNRPLPNGNRKMMEMFLLQLGNHKLTFTVYQLFTIDLTVLTSVAGAVTTYLVILIQFQNSLSP